ncbi:E3 ubiquitin protein ligase UPL1-like protein [Tanacetum coccineum]
MHSFSAKQRLNAINISRSVAMAYVMDQSDETGATSIAPNENGIDPNFLEALPEDLRAKVLASQQARSTPAPAVSSLVAEDIDLEFLAARPLDIQAEVLAQQCA